MNHSARAGLLASLLALVTTWGPGATARGDEAAMRDIPADFAPFEYLIGRWKGQGIPKDNPTKQFRGWTETHSWAWIFAQGKPAGLAVTIEGGKLLATGKLTYDPARRQFRLEAIEPKPSDGRIRFEGSLDQSAKILVLERKSVTGKSARDSGKLRLSLRPNANFIRYTMTGLRQEPGAFQFHPMIEVGVTKEGESFAAGSTSSERPKCIVTGGAATMTLTYEGSTFSICCTGCRDEFNDNPEKYVKKAALLLGSQGGKSNSSQSPSSRVSRFEDAFAADVADSREGASPSSDGPKTSPAQRRQGGPARPRRARTRPRSDRKSSKRRPAAEKDAARKAASKQAARAATLLRMGQNLEKTGNITAALSYFRQIVKDFPADPAAKTAALG